MKTPTRLLVLCAALLCGAMAKGAVLFDENFDGAPYTNNTPFNDPTNPVTGVNKLSHGYWSLSNLGTAVVSASTATSLSSSRSMALTVLANGDRAQAIGLLGATGAAGTPTAQELVVKFSFNLTDTSQLTYFLVRGSNEVNLGNITLGAGAVRATFNGVATTISTISANTWYNVEMTLSANPGSGSNTYSVKLFNDDFSLQLGSTATGAFAQASGSTTYRYFTAYNQGYAGQSSAYSTYFDNISVNTIPEPGVMALLTFGMLGFIVLRRFRGRGVHSPAL